MGSLNIPKHVAITFPRTYSRILSKISFYSNPMNKRLLVFSLISDMLRLVTYLVDYEVENITVDLLPRNVLKGLNIDLSYIENILIKVLYKLDNIDSQILLIEDAFSIRRIFFEPRSGMLKLNVVVGYDKDIEFNRSLMLLTLRIGDLLRESPNNYVDVSTLNRNFRECLLINSDPDLVIIFGDSIFPNFIPLNLAYSEFIFINKELSEVSRDDINYAIKEYSRRSRRFGK